MSDYVCLFTICRNEQSFLDEFIKYYFAIGVDKIVFIDNNVDNEQNKIINKYENIIYVKDSFSLNGKSLPLHKKYGSLVYEKFFWTLFFDRDEIINLGEFSNIKELLMLHEEHNLLSLNWKCFASKKEINKNLITNLTDRLVVNPQHKIFNHCKSIVRTKDSDFLFSNPHYPSNFTNSFNLTTKKVIRATTQNNLDSDDYYKNPSLHHYHYHGLQNFIRKVDKPDKEIRKIENLLDKYNNYDKLFEAAYDEQYKSELMMQDDSIIKFLKRENLYDKIYSE